VGRSDGVLGLRMRGGGGGLDLVGYVRRNISFLVYWVFWDIVAEN
jgi:hypothetical protein